MSQAVQALVTFTDLRLKTRWEIIYMKVFNACADDIISRACAGTAVTVLSSTLGEQGIEFKPSWSELWHAKSAAANQASGLWTAGHPGQANPFVARPAAETPSTAQVQASTAQQGTPPQCTLINANTLTQMADGYTLNRSQRRLLEETEVEVHSLYTDNRDMEIIKTCAASAYESYRQEVETERKLEENLLQSKEWAIGWATRMMKAKYPDYARQFDSASRPVIQRLHAVWERLVDESYRANEEQETRDYIRSLASQPVAMRQGVHTESQSSPIDPSQPPLHRTRTPSTPSQTSDRLRPPSRTQSPARMRPPNQTRSRESDTTSYDGRSIRSSHSNSSTSSTRDGFSEGA